MKIMKPFIALSCSLLLTLSAWGSANAKDDVSTKSHASTSAKASIKDATNINPGAITRAKPKNIAKSEDKLEIDDYIAMCKQDLQFVRSQMKKNSAAYANKIDKEFHRWFKEGNKNTLKLISKIGDLDDCYYAIKYYINGFHNSHISIRGYIALPSEEYPGLLSAKKGKGHYIIYKHPALKYLKNVNIGDELTHINGIKIDRYYKDFLLPFYANDKSELTLESASIYALIVDGNRFKPSPRRITLKQKQNKDINIDLKYTELKGAAVEAAKKIKQPDRSAPFKVELVSNGVWIRIPSFFPARNEAIYYTGMLSMLKNDLAKEDYILFDMRGNRGGASKWSRPIIRNLWGDAFIKSLGKKHDYNKKWQKNLRVSAENFPSFKKIYSPAASKSYASLIKRKKDFFLKKWSIYNDKENLYTNLDSKPFNAKIYVLTDHFCRSTCWKFVNELKQIPGVTHIGEETTIQSIYSYAKRERASSEHFDFFYPTQIRVKPSYKLGTALVPSEIYKGDFRDEASVIDWALSITEKEDEDF
ncbi:MAG: hypothetical protein COA94_07275 [Rickettsiales bacterium]|nr:MAG: hypothetical protein COA94_07275 [Rickettsiales bacterium]